jgi:hypothetical protein
MKKNIIKIGAAIAMAFGMPLLVFASSKTLSDLMTLITGYFSNFIKLIISFAILTFVWNVYKYYVKADADRAEAGKYVLYSVVGFFIILSFWGLVNILDRTFNLDKQQPNWPFNVNGVPSSNQNVPPTNFNGNGLPPANYNGS